MHMFSCCLQSIKTPKTIDIYIILFLLYIYIYLFLVSILFSKSNSAFYLLKEQDPDKWENFKAWNILKSTPMLLEPQGDASETMEDEEEEEVAMSPPNEANVEDQPSMTDASADDPPEEKEEQETMTNVSSTSSYKPSDDSSTTTSLVNVVSHASRQKKQHLGRDAAKGKLQLDKERQKQTKLLSEMNDTI